MTKLQVTLHGPPCWQPAPRLDRGSRACWCADFHASGRRAAAGTTPMSVKAFFSFSWKLAGRGFAGMRTRRGWAAPGGRAGSYQVTRSAGWGIRGGRQIGSRPARGCGSGYEGRAAAEAVVPVVAGWRRSLSAWLDGLAVSGGDGVGGQGDVRGVGVAGDGARADGDGGVAGAGGDPRDGLPGGGAGQLPGVRGAPGGVPADDGERLAGADAGPGGDGAAEGVAVQEVPVADDQPGGGGIGPGVAGGVRELADEPGDGTGMAAAFMVMPAGRKRVAADQAGGGSPAAEGRLLPGHEAGQARGRVPGRPADRFKAGTGRGSRYAGRAVPGRCAARRRGGGGRPRGRHTASGSR
jgi:hypothetical protein